MELEKGINRAKQLANLKGKKDTEFYENLVFWLMELKEYKEHSQKGQNYSGMNDTRLYHIWNGMKARCYNAASMNYKYYGGRGIKICDEWKNNKGFEHFYEWSMANGYDDSLSIDRIDPNGNYEPSNCRWVTAVVQANNKRRNQTYGKEKKMTLTYKQTTLTPKEWGDRLGISEYVIRQRLRKGWSVEKTLETPIDKSKSRRGQGRKKKTEN